MIYHLCLQQDWQTAQEQGAYRADSLEMEGFIHASRRDQVAGSANRYYAGQTDLLLLEIDPSRVTVPLKNETARNGELYPHFYGSLNLDAVVRVLPYLPDASGVFQTPDV